MSEPLRIEPRRWTESEIALLRDSYYRLSVSEIAVLLSRKSPAVRNKAYELKITRRPSLPAELLSELKALYEDAGESGVLDLAGLARKWDRSKANLCRVAKQMGCRVNPNRKKVEQRKDRRKFKGDAEAHRASLSQKAKDQIATHGHPRGMLGKKHTAEVRRAIGEKSASWWADLTKERRQQLKDRMQRAAREVGPPKVARGTWKAEWRTIGGTRGYYRSRWEANYARWLQCLKERGDIIDWEHEPKVFWFENILRGVRSYKPDFCVQDRGGEITWHEVKGWMDTRSVTTLRRFAKYYPDEILILVREAQMRSLSKVWSEAIHDWEYDARGRP